MMPTQLKIIRALPHKSYERTFYLCPRCGCSIRWMGSQAIGRCSGGCNLWHGRDKQARQVVGIRRDKHDAINWNGFVTWRKGDRYFVRLAQISFDGASRSILRVKGLSIGHLDHTPAYHAAFIANAEHLGHTHVACWRLPGR